MVAVKEHEDEDVVDHFGQEMAKNLVGIAGNQQKLSKEQIAEEDH